MEDDFITINEAAEELGVTRTTIWRRIKNGTLEVFQSQADQRERLVRRADILALKRPISISQGKTELARQAIAA